MKNIYKIKVGANLYYFNGSEKIIFIDEVATSDERLLMENVADIMIKALLDGNNLIDIKLAEDTNESPEKRAFNYVSIKEGDIKIGLKDYEAWCQGGKHTKDLIPFEIYSGENKVGWVVEDNIENAYKVLQRRIETDSRLKDLSLFIKK